MLLDDIAAFISASTSHGYSSTSTPVTLFKADLPESAGDKAGAVFEYGGMAADRAMGASASAPLFENPRFQVMIRDSSTGTENARNAIESIYSALDGVANTIINVASSIRYLWIEALGPPALLSRDDNDRPLYTCDFECRKERG